jgi:hypothetical protein
MTHIPAHGHNGQHVPLLAQAQVQGQAQQHTPAHSQVARQQTVSVHQPFATGSRPNFLGKTPVFEPKNVTLNGAFAGQFMNKFVDTPAIQPVAHDAGVHIAVPGPQAQQHLLRAGNDTTTQTHDQDPQSTDDANKDSPGATIDNAKVQAEGQWNENDSATIMGQISAQVNEELFKDAAVGGGIFQELDIAHLVAEFDAEFGNDVATNPEAEVGEANTAPQEQPVSQSQHSVSLVS